jgi:hypothetical protein
MDADLFAELESGAEIEEMDADGRPLALIRFVPRSEADYWRTAELMSPYLPAQKVYFDSRKQHYPDFFSPWQRYIEAAREAKAEILSGRRPMPLPPARPTVATPAASRQEPRSAPPEEPMKVHEYQRLLREKRGTGFDYWAGNDDRDR